MLQGWVINWVINLFFVRRLQQKLFSRNQEISAQQQLPPGESQNPSSLWNERRSFKISLSSLYSSFRLLDRTMPQQEAMQSQQSIWESAFVVYDSIVYPICSIGKALGRGFWRFWVSSPDADAARRGGALCRREALAGLKGLESPAILLFHFCMFLLRFLGCFFVPEI